MLRRAALAAACGAVRAAAAGDACDPYTVLHGVGLMNGPTTLGHWVNVSEGECCAKCAADTRCLAWTTHNGPQRDCYTTADVNRHDVASATSGCLPGALPTPSPPVPTPEPTQAPPTPEPKPPLGRLPNMILILTDDQDIHLGGMEPMPKTRRLLGAKGATATNWFIHTPVCCPSRAETLTGRYFHNVKLDKIHVDLSVVNTTRSSGGCMSNGCMCVDEKKVNPNTFAVDLHSIGYQVGMFGKHLNNCPKTLQPGFTRWFANGGGSYFNTQFFDDRSPTGSFTANSSFYAGYQTSILGNVSIGWIREVVSNKTGGAYPPFFAYIGVHAPHTPSSPAPWYADAFGDPALSKHYQTPNYNASCPDHHWVVAQQQPITAGEAGGVDALFRNRWRTLLSVDDLVEGVVQAVEDLGIDDSTYFFFTSDHGYNLGQFRLTGNKLHAYEQTLRIPMFIRGPGIAAGSTFALPASNADMAPTWLGLAGIENPHMDGSSIVPHLLEHPPHPAPKAWRDYHWAEYNSLGNWWNGKHLIDDPISHTFRALRFVNSTSYGDILYAEYTSLVDWDFKNYSGEYKFYELFNVSADPWQFNNVYAGAPAELKEALHAVAEREFGCAGSSCA